MTPAGFEPTPLRTGALSQRLRPLGQSVLLDASSIGFSASDRISKMLLGRVEEFSDFNRQLFGRLGHQYPNRSDLRRIHRYMSETNDKPPSHPQVLCVEAFSALRKRFRWSDPEPAGSLFLNHVECPITIVEVFPLCAFKSQVKRRRGGIEPLHVSMPLELKSSPSTSPTHPGR